MNRFKCFSTLAVVGWLGFGVASQSSAAVIYDQISGGTASSQSDASGFQRVAEDFVPVVSGDIESVTWRGLYGFTGTLQDPLLFSLTFYGDNGGLPDTNNVIGNEQVVLNQTDLTDTGLTVLTQIVWEFSAGLSTPVAVDAGIVLTGLAFGSLIFWRGVWRRGSWTSRWRCGGCTGRTGS